MVDFLFMESLIWTRRVVGEGLAEPAATHDTRGGHCVYRRVSGRLEVLHEVTREIAESVGRKLNVPSSDPGLQSRDGRWGRRCSSRSACSAGRRARTDHQGVGNVLGSSSPPGGLIGRSSCGGLAGTCGICGAFSDPVALFVGYVAVTGVQVWLTSRESLRRAAARR